MLLGGLISLRPDHDPLIARVREAAASGSWCVLVHTRGHEEQRRARDALEGAGKKVVGTL